MLVIIFNDLISFLENYSKHLWLKLLKQLNVDPKKLIVLHKNKLIRLLIDEYTPTESLEGALQTIVYLQPNVIIPPVVEFVVNKLKESANVHVTRDEYFTFLTPENELYDKSVIAG